MNIILLWLGLFPSLMWLASATELLLNTTTPPDCDEGRRRALEVVLAAVTTGAILAVALGLTAVALGAFA